MMMNAVIKLLIATIFFGTISCGISPKESSFKKVEDNYKPLYCAEQITEDLEFALNKKDTVLIENIFAEWENTVRPNSTGYIYQNDTIAAIYEVFELFYNPNDILKLGNLELENDLNLNCKHVVVQNKILYSILNSNKISKIDWINSKKNLINNFRPPITLDGRKVLYLTDEYEESINDFLAPQAQMTKEKKEIPFEYPDGSQKKYDLLKDYIPLLLDHKENLWHFETFPYVNRIFFNKSITKAKIDFSVSSQSGIAIIEKEGNDWVITESKISLR